MKLMSAICTTGVIAGVVWGVALLQVPSVYAKVEQTTNSALTSVSERTIQEEVATTEHTPVSEANKPQVAQSTKIDDVARRLPTKKILQAEKSVHVKLSGVSAEIDLSAGSIDGLWQTFHQAVWLQAQLKEHPEKVYVVYRNFSNNYQSAHVSIGYPTRLLNRNQSVTVNVQGQFLPLLSKSNYDQSGLADAWSKIDYRNQPVTIVEVHHLNKLGQTVASELMVQYK